MVGIQLGKESGRQAGREAGRQPVHDITAVSTRVKVNCIFLRAKLRGAD